MKAFGKNLGLGWRVLLTLSALLATLLAATACFQGAERSLVLTTTTSTYDSGLLDHIIPPFEEEHNAHVRVISVGTGQALAIAARGDADVVLVHAPSLELQFVEEGNGIDRTYVMYNDFVVLGPPTTPPKPRASPTVQRLSAASPKPAPDSPPAVMSRAPT